MEIWDVFKDCITSAKIRKIGNGGKAKLSIAEVTNQFVSVQRAKYKFSDEVYDEIQKNYGFTQRSTEKVLMGQKQLTSTIFAILLSFDQIAPCEFFSGNGSVENDALVIKLLHKMAPDEVRELRRKLYWDKIELESIDRLYTDSKKLLDGTPDSERIQGLAKPGKLTDAEVAKYINYRAKVENSLVDLPAERTKILDEISQIESRLAKLGWGE